MTAQLARALFFKDNPKYKAIVNRAIGFAQANQVAEAKKELSYLPTDDKLLENLHKKIAHKSVGTGIKKILEGKVTNKFEAAKTYASILTHIMIECEQGNLEYQVLIEQTIGKIYQLL